MSASPRITWHYRDWVALALCSLLVCTGCGKPKVVPPAAGSPAPKPEEARPANVISNQPQEQPEQQPVADSPADPMFDDNSDSVFEVTDAPQETWEIAAAPPERQDVFDVVVLPEGVDSRQFTLVTDDTNASQATGPGTQIGPGTNASTGDNPGSPADGGNGGAAGDVVWAVPAGFSPVPGLGTDPETGLPERIRHSRDLVDMVLIKPGVFFRGVDDHGANVGPQHTVLLEEPYYIDVAEVSVARYEEFRTFYRKQEGRVLTAPSNAAGDPQLPAVGISYLDARLYARWTDKELPTESQWERAARGTHGLVTPWGEGRPIWQRPRQPGQLDAVMSFPADVSPDGLFDMAGNAREWCQDFYAADIYQKELSSASPPLRNPVGPKSTTDAMKSHVVRGSSTDWNLWHRAGQPQAQGAPDIGFRCVLVIKPKADDEETTKPKPRTNKAEPKPSTKKPKTTGPGF